MIQLPPDPIDQPTAPSSQTVTPGKFNAELAKKVLLGLPNPDPSLLNAMKSDSKMTKEEIEELVKKVWEKRQIEIETNVKSRLKPDVKSSFQQTLNRVRSQRHIEFETDGKSDRS